MSYINCDFLQRLTDELESGQKILQVCTWATGEIETTQPGDEAERFVSDGRHDIHLIVWDRDKAPQFLLDREVT